MLQKIKKEQCHILAPLYSGWEETLIWSCLQGRMGEAWTDDLNNPQTAQIIIGDFCFVSGRPNKEAITNIPKDYLSDCIIMTPQNEDWERLIELEYNENCRKVSRYAIKKERDIFDEKKLMNFIERLPKEYTLRKIDKEIYKQIFEEDWSRDLCSQFETYENFLDAGLGFVIIHENTIVSGASSYTFYDKGIEIEIDTRTDYRRKGLATICAAALILECLQKDLYPSWDAANLASVALAEKLGYHFQKEYIVYMLPVKH